jgi:hypothetical protein
MGDSRRNVVILERVMPLMKGRAAAEEHPQKYIGTLCPPARQTAIHRPSVVNTGKGNMETIRVLAILLIGFALSAALIALHSSTHDIALSATKAQTVPANGPSLRKSASARTSFFPAYFRHNTAG